jgi:broad specificity phosphatase PhoE
MAPVSKEVASRLLLFGHPFYFLRHGESESNLDNTIAGWRDVPLTPRGRQQARAAVPMLRNRGITAIYASALVRSRATAAPIADALALPVIVLTDLAERNWGEIDGQPRSARTPGVTPAGAETPEQFAARVERALARIAPGGTPLIVGHAGVFRVICELVGLVAPSEYIANAFPVRFVPPDRPTGVWRFDPLTDGP